MKNSKNFPIVEITNRICKRIVVDFVPYKIRNAFIENRHLKKYNSFFYQRIKQNKDLKDSHKGERCFIFGNGPSLAKINFKHFENEFTFTMNQLTRNKNFHDLKTNFHFWSDERFFHLDPSKSEDKELLEVILNVNEKNRRPAVFFDITATSLIKQNNLDSLMDLHFFDCDGARKNKSVKQNIDVSKPIPNMPTTVFYAIWFAVYMGFSKIYLLGCDCSGFVSTAFTKLQSAEKSLYAYKISENEKKRMEKIAKQTSLRNELQSYVYIFDYYAYMKQYCNYRGIDLINCTYGGLLEELPKVSIDDILPNTLVSD